MHTIADLKTVSPLNTVEDDRRISICGNPHMNQHAENDSMYHYGLNTKQHDLKKLFGKVNVVITAGSSSRIRTLAKELHAKYCPNDSEDSLHDFAELAGRYSMFCVENVLMFNHGIGTGSASIAFHEILKLLDYAEVPRDGFVFIRIGTCGGIGIQPGTICLSERVLTETLSENFPFVECGKLRPMPMLLDPTLRSQLADTAASLGIAHTECKTLGTNDFYLGQGRLDGAFCGYGESERFQFLQKLHKQGIRNIEMESHTFSAFCTRANIKGAVMCVSLLNRLGKGKDNDLIVASKDTLTGWMENGMLILKEFIERRRKQMGEKPGNN